VTTGHELILEADRWMGQPYSTGARIHQSVGPTDCSGLIFNCYWNKTGHPPPATVTVTFYEWAMRSGTTIPKAMALGIAGSCLLMPEDPLVGWGPNGHIGFSDGVGGTREATPPRVQHLSASYQPWGSHAMLLPGIDYGGGQGPVAQRYGGGCMIVGDKSNGAVYLLGSGHAHHIGAPSDVNRLKFIGVPDAGMLDPLEVIGWMKTFGAWG
jgi:hypothetical protein